MLTAEQLLKRHEGIGGSDAGVICGLSPFKTVEQLLAEKVTGERQEQQWPGHSEWGDRLEPLVADAYCEKTGRKFEVSSATHAHPDHPWMLANVDRIILKAMPYQFDMDWDGVLEVKTTAYSQKSKWKDAPPDHYQLQLQHYLAVLDLSWGSIAVLIAGNDFRYYDIQRDDAVIAALIEKEESFWKTVLRMRQEAA